MNEGMWLSGKRYIRRQSKLVIWGAGMVSTGLKAKVKGLGNGFDSHQFHQFFSCLYDKMYLYPPRANVGGKMDVRLANPMLFIYMSSV